MRGHRWWRTRWWMTGEGKGPGDISLAGRGAESRSYFLQMVNPGASPLIPTRRALPSWTTRQGR